MNEALQILIEGICTGATRLTCEKHGYVAAQTRRSGHLVPVPPPPRGCPNCLKAYFYTDWAMTPANKRQERLDELSEVIHHVVEYEQKGSFGKDFELYEPGDPRFQVNFHKDAADDDTGEDKKPIVLTDSELN